MKHNKTNEEGRTPNVYFTPIAQRQEEKGPRERSETPREDKDRQNSTRKHTRTDGGQNNPTTAPGRSGYGERERRGSRTSFGGYQGL